MRSFLFLLLLAPVTVLGQWVLPEPSLAFPTEEVATIRIEIDPDSLDLIFFEDSLYSNHEYPATFTFESSEYTEVIENVGFRLRGNTSREAEKKSFKISFNTFEEGGNFLGFQKFNLRGEQNDPSLLRSRLNWEWAHQLGLTNSRVAHIRLYINDEYRGLYLNTEHIDDQFVEKRFGSDAGNLYKCHYLANLEWWGDNPEDYKFAPWGTRVYELKTNELADDYAELVHFIDVLNNTPSADLPCELEKVFDVDKYLRTVAFEILIGHWDGYVWNNNNYYLYQRPEDRRFEFIEYDLDNTLGIDWVGDDWTERNIYEFDNDFRPLYERLMAQSVYRNAFSYYLNEIMEKVTYDDIEDRTTEILGFITEAALEDEYRTMDFGFTDDDFENGLYTDWGGHVEYGILPYIEARYQSALEQLEEFEQPLPGMVIDNAPLIDPSIRWKVTTPEGADEVFAEIIVNGEVTATTPLYDDGLHDDGLANDNLWSNEQTLSGNLEGIHYQITVERDESSTLLPCEPQWVWIQPLESNVVLNEVMSNNDFTVSDQMGEYDDWFELFNGNPTGVLGSDYWVSDNPTYAQKFRLPASVIGGNDHLLIWADKDDEQGLDHANFRLSNNGEDLMLSTMDEGHIRLVDHIFFPGLPSDISYGRENDGTTPWILFENPTPDAENGVLSVVEATTTLPHPYPNPTRDVIYASFGASYALFDGAGRQINILAIGEKIDLSPLPSGVYILIIDDRKYRILKK